MRPNTIDAHGAIYVLGDIYDERGVRITTLEAENVELRGKLDVTNRLACIRDSGWSVAVHNDYRLQGKFHTFWLFTNGDRCVKGEGPSDLAALSEIVEKLVAQGRRKLHTSGDKAGYAAQS